MKMQVARNCAPKIAPSEALCPSYIGQVNSGNLPHLQKTITLCTENELLGILSHYSMAEGGGEGACLRVQKNPSLPGLSSRGVSELHSLAAMASPLCHAATSDRRCRAIAQQSRVVHFEYRAPALSEVYWDRSRTIPKAHRIPIQCRALKYYQRVLNRHAGRDAGGFGPLRNKHP
jgi:hypothetical protein